MVKFFDTYSVTDFPAFVGKLELDEFVQSQTAQLSNAQLPKILCITTFTNHIEIFNRCKNIDERIFYMLYSAHNHLKAEELRRCIVSHTFDSVMSKEKQISPAMLNQYPGLSLCLKTGFFLIF